MQQSHSFNEILTFARNFAIENRQNVIDVPTIALGVLQAESPFSEIFSEEEKEILSGQIIEKTTELGQHPLETETVPYTMAAGLLIKFARQYAEEAGDGEMDVYHLMFALLSYPNEIATLFRRKGWIFENYLAAVNRIVSPEIETGKLEIDMQPSVNGPYPKLRKKFWAEDYKKSMAENLLAEAHRHASFGKYGTARLLCEVALDIIPGSQEANQLIIYCLCNEKSYDEAIELYSKLGLEDETLRMNIGICYRETGRHEQALEIFRSFAEQTPDLHNVTGYSLCSLGRYEEAINEYDAAIAMNPDYAFAWNNKGYALLRAGQLAAAKECIAHSLALDKGNSFAYRNMALVNLEEKNKEEALSNIDKALYYGYREKFGDDIDGIKEKAEEL